MRQCTAIISSLGGKLCFSFVCALALAGLKYQEIHPCSAAMNINSGKIYISLIMTRCTMNNTVAAILRLRFIHYCVSVNNLQWENSFDYECRISAQLWMFDWEDSFNYRQRTVNSVRQEETSANYASLNNNPDIACSLHSPYHIIWWRWWVVRWCGHRRVHFLELRRDRRRAFTGFYWQTLRSVSDVWFAGE